MRYERIFLAFLLIVDVPAVALALAVTNVLTQQRPGTKLVDITYDLKTDDGKPVGISVMVSDDSGTTFNVKAQTFSGDSGPSVSPGTGKHVIWDAGRDIPDVSGKHYLAKVTASGEISTAGGPPTNGRIWFRSPRTQGANDSEIWSMEPDGTDARKMVELTSGSGYGSFAIKPDGTDLIFVHNDGTYKLKLRKTSGGPISELLDAGRSIDGQVKRIGSLGWSPDGTKIVYVNYGDDNVIILKADSLSVLLKGNLPSPYYDPFGTKWSSNGTQIFLNATAFPLPLGSKADWGSYILVVKSDGTNLRPILSGTTSTIFGPEAIFGPVAISPDGSQIAYSQIDKGIYLANSDGTRPAQITTQKGYSISWSPDGKEITFDDQNVLKIYKIKTDGTNLQTIEPKGAGQFSPFDPIWAKRLTQIISVFSTSNETALNTFDIPPTPKVGNGTGELGIGGQKTKMLGSVRPGQKVDILVTFNQEIAGSTGFAVILTFDPTKLLVVSGKGDGVFASATFPGPPQVRDTTVTYAGAFLGQTTTAKGPIAVLTFQTSDSFSGDTEIILTKLTIRIPGSGTDFIPQASVVISSKSVGTPSPDFDGNGVVDFDDFFQFASNFGKKRDDAGFDAKFDLDSNGEVDFNDFFIFADAFGKKI